MIAHHLAQLLPKGRRRDDEVQAGLIWVARVGEALLHLVSTTKKPKKGR